MPLLNKTIAMKKVLVILCSVAFSLHSFSQVQGDISSQTIVSANHDYDNCASFGTMGFVITISNSFVNDTVWVIDPINGSQVFWTWNAGGANPWVVTVPQQLTAFTPDQAVNNGVATLFFPQVKIINGQDTLWPNNIHMVNVPTPCTYGDVTGKVYIDSNNDCTFNGGDTPLNGVYVIAESNITNTQGSSTSSTGSSTSNQGDYFIYMQETWMTSYTIGLPANYQFIFPYASCSQAPFTFTTLPQTNVDLAVECADIDVSAHAYNSGVVRPGIPFMLHPRVQNEGCDPAAGVLKLVLDPNVTYNAGLSTYPASSVSGDTLFWNYSNLSNLSNGAYWNSFMSSIHLTPDVSVNIGDTLCFQIFSSIPGNDIDPSNNQSSLCLPVVNSYDPNAKEVSPAGIGAPGYIPLSTSELTYTIYFQNTGNAPAINVNVVDSIKEHILPNSLRILASSHAMTPTWLAPGVVNFGFSNINLPDSTSNEPGSHGFVTFVVDLEDLEEADEIKNTAHIYFDFNPAIVTNTTLNTVNTIFDIDENTTPVLSVYPNPSNGVYTINMPEQTSDITIYNMTGKAVFNAKANSSIMQIDISHLPSGVYVLNVDGNNTSFRQSLIKR